MESQHGNGVAHKPPQTDCCDRSEHETNKMLPETAPTNDDETSTATPRMIQPRTIPTFGKALFLICGVVNFGISFGFPTSLSVYFLDWQDSFQENRAYTASIHATCVGTLNTAAIIPGLLMSRCGDRITLLLGCCLASLGMILSSFATGIPYMVMTTGVVFGMGCCMINLPTIPCITSVFTRNQSIFIASLSFGSGLVNTALPFFYTFLAAEFGWRGSHLITGGLILQACISSLVITSYRTVYSDHDVDEKLLEKSDNCDKGDNCAPETLQPKLPVTGFLLEGISMTSLHSSTFGSQILGARSTKNASDSCKHSRENNAILLDPHHKSVLKHRGSNGVISDSPTLSYSKKLFLRVQSSHPFLFDVIYLLEVMTSSFCLSAIYSTVALMMDFTKTKGYTDSSVSVFLVFLSFLFSMVGKIFTGLANLIPVVHSLHLLCFYGFCCCIMMITLVYTDEYIPLCIEFALVGVLLGGLASIYPKCVLDMKTVDTRTYPLALGINNSILGLFDVTLPVIMGYSVDVYQTYTLVLFLYSAIILVLCMAMTVTFYLKCRSELLHSRQESKE